MGFFPEGVVQPRNPMRDVVSRLSPKAKQAMYAAASKNMIIRGSWSDRNGNGCAFNKAGENVGQGVFSIGDAAHVFEMEQADVHSFIRRWDSLDCSDFEANRYLIEALKESGTHTPVARGRRIIRGYVYKSEATKWAEQLESGELRVEDIPGCAEIAELLSACPA